MAALFRPLIGCHINHGDCNTGHRQFDRLSGPPYTKHCASCHGPSGDGDGSAAAELGIHPAKLSESRSQSDGALFWKITTGKKPMPGYGAKLSEADRWNVINYLKTLSGK